MFSPLQPNCPCNSWTSGQSRRSDWASETTNYANEVSEMALGHQIPNKVEAAYRRGTLLSKRRDMMNDWSLFISGAKNSLYSEDPAKDNTHE